MKGNKGITLIALIITIIVLLILAGVSISMLTGDNGITTNATKAQSKNAYSYAEEQMKLANTSVRTAIETNLSNNSSYNATSEDNFSKLVDLVKKDLGFINLSNEIEGKWKVEADNGIIRITYIDSSISTESGANQNGKVVGKITVEAQGVSFDFDVVLKVKEVKTSGHTAQDLTYTWDEINNVAKIISNNYGEGETQINRETAEVIVLAEGKEYTIGIGDTAIMTDTSNNNYTVRVLGFNHDLLTDQTVYGGTNIYAGISFEFVTCFDNNAQMNSTNTNAGGWMGSLMYKTLNGESASTGTFEGRYATLKDKDKIKTVKKEYIETYDQENVKTSDYNKLWLLSCSEIWNNGYSENKYGYAIAKEGEQYKYYKDINSTLIKKNSENTAQSWWFRSPYYDSNRYFCNVSSAGYSTYSYANKSYGVAPGFSI